MDTFSTFEKHFNSAKSFYLTLIFREKFAEAELLQDIKNFECTSTW